MTVTDANDNVVATFARNELSNMAVDEVSTPEAGVNDIEIGKGVTFAFDAQTSTVRMLADGALDVYDISGRHLVSIAAVSTGETVDLSEIAAGVVIIKSGTYNLKVALK